MKSEEVGQGSLERRLGREFYTRPALEVAPDLIGKLLVRRLNGIRLSGWIVEVEAYMGEDDPASHAYKGPRPRNLSMFGSPGHLYVYRSYGIHSCGNVVTSPEGVATAVLLRAIEPKDGIDVMKAHRGVDSERLLCSGPGRLCQALAISIQDDGVDLLQSDILIADVGRHPDVDKTRRIGITAAAERQWRFVAKGSRFTSRSVPAR